MKQSSFKSKFFYCLTPLLIVSSAVMIYNFYCLVHLKLLKEIVAVAKVYKQTDYVNCYRDIWIANIDLIDVSENVNKDERLNNKEFINFAKKAYRCLNGTRAIANFYNQAGDIILASNRSFITDLDMKESVKPNLIEKFLKKIKFIKDNNSLVYEDLKLLTGIPVKYSYFVSDDTIMQTQKYIKTTYLLYPNDFLKVYSGKIEIIENITYLWDKLSKVTIVFISTIVLLVMLACYICFLRDIKFLNKINRNIKEIKKLSNFGAELKQKDNNKSEFLAYVLENIKHKLNIIINFVQVFDSESIESQKYKGYINDIKKSCLDLSKIANNLSDYSKAILGKLEINNKILDINKLLEDCIRIIKENPNTIAKKLKIFCNTKDLFINADKERFQQVILSILSNAIKYTEENGEIDVRVIARKDYENTNIIEISIADNGIGIDDKDLDNIDLFVKKALNTHDKRDESLGIGLSFARLLVELMKGQFFIKSKIGYGTTVTILFAREISDI